MKNGKSIWGIYKPICPWELPTLEPQTRQDYVNFLNRPEISTPSAPGWYRIVQPLDELAKHGWKTDHRFGYPYPRDEDWNIVTIQMADNPAGLDLVEMLLAEGNTLVHDFDDNIFLLGEERWNEHRVNKDIPYAEVEKTSKIVTEKSALVTVSTPYLAEVIRDRTGHPNIQITPNYVAEAITKLVRNKKDHLVIGWAGGGSHIFDVQLINNVVVKFLQRHKDAEFHLIGELSEQFTFQNTDIRHTPWIILDHSRKYYRAVDFDIALIPLASGEFELSKSPIKAIEAMALGIPVIASDHEVYRGTVIDGVTGFLVNPGQFADRLEELANDEELRETMGNNAREAAKAWTIEGNWDKWDQAYSGLL